MNTLAYSEYDIVHTSAILITRVGFEEIPTLCLNDFVLFVRASYDEEDIAPYYLSSLNDDLFNLSKNIAARMVIKMLGLANLANPEFFPNAPGVENEMPYRLLQYHLPQHIPLPPRFSPHPLSYLTECGDFFISTFCVPIYAPLLISCEIVVLPLTPVGEEHETRAFSKQPKEHTGFASIIVDIQSIECESLIGLYYHDEVILFNHLYTILLQRHRISNFSISFFLPSSPRVIVGKQAVLQQVRAAFDAYGR
jgi:hypothetical protein